MLPTLQIGPLVLQTPGLILIAGLWLGLSLGERLSAHRRVTPDKLNTLAMLVLMTALVGGRLAYVAVHPALFASSPLDVITLNSGLFDMTAAVLLGSLALVVTARRQRLTLGQAVDALTPVAAVVAVAIGLSHLASGAGFGAAADLPWSIEIWGARRHPSQVYETLAALAVLALIWRSARASRPAGAHFLTFAALTAGWWLFLEGLRGDSTLILGGLRQGQVTAWIVLAGSLFMLDRLERLAGLPAPDSPEEGSEHG